MAVKKDKLAGSILKNIEADKKAKPGKKASSHRRPSRKASIRASPGETFWARATTR